MSSGRDPRRRNRAQGTARRGHRRQSPFVLPGSRHEGRKSYERLRRPRVIERLVGSQTVAFLIEPPREGYIHACTVDDVAEVLRLVPAADRVGIRTIVLRQPTRKEETFLPSWGRILHLARLGRHSGPTIQLLAQPRGLTFTWRRSLDPATALELERLRDDGHGVVEGKRRITIAATLEAIRATQLHRTLLHEIGHHVDRRLTLRRGGDPSRKPQAEREEFARRYAADLAARLCRRGRLPFPRRDEPWRLAGDSLPREWFASGAADGSSALQVD